MEMKLSIIIPSHKDPLIHQTIESLLQNMRGEFEIIVVLDGYIPDVPIKNDPRIKVLALEKNVGMRDAINAGMKLSQEAIEIALKTWLGGGKVMVNKKTWYAHKHRKFGRISPVKNYEIDAGNRYSQDYWLNNRWEKRVHNLDWLM